MKYFFLSIIVLCNLTASAQIAGRGAYAFLNMSPSARSLALGSNFISAVDKDISVGWQNPAAINPLMHNHAFVNYNNHVADINSGYFSYGRDYKKIGTFVASVMYLDYGKFEGTLPSGISTGTFTVKDQCVMIGYGKSLHERFRVGASLKYVYSIYESYISNGVASDLSCIYSDTSKNLNITAFANNIGVQAIPYGKTTERQPLPFSMAIAIGKRLKHLPLRYNLVIHDLQKPDMRYSYTTDEKDENGNVKIKKMTMGDNIMRHFTLGAELNFTQHFVLRLGYDHMRRRETSPDQKRGTTGFSFGLGFRVSKLHISYSIASLFPGYNSNQFSLLCNLGEFYKRRRVSR